MTFSFRIEADFDYLFVDGFTEVFTGDYSNVMYTATIDSNEAFVRFVSDHSGGETGFNLAYSATGLSFVTDGCFFLVYYIPTPSEK